MTRLKHIGRRGVEWPPRGKTKEQNSSHGGIWEVKVENSELESSKNQMGLERRLSTQEHIQVLERLQVQFPAPMLAHSQGP